MGSVVGTDPVFHLEVIEYLRVIKPEVSQPRISPGRGIIRRFRKSIVALEADVVAGTFLEANLKRVVPGVGIQCRQSLEPAVKLRVGFQQQLLRDGGIYVSGIGDVGRVKYRR